MTTWHHTPLARLATGGVVAAAVGVPVGASLGLAVGLLSGWAAGALWLAGWIITVVWPMDAERTRTHARREDPGRRIARAISSVGAVASLGAVGVVVLQGHDPDQQRALLFAAIAVVSVVASWLLIQVDYMLRYARMYYADPVGGIDFNGTEPPQYTDFAYVSVGLGMTYQIADTNISTVDIRKVVIGQTILAYLFGAVILATVINLVTGLA